MSDFSIRSDNVDVEQIMRQIRARIREKRGVDYTDEEVRELANVKLEKFIDAKGVRSNLLEEYRRLASAEPAPPNYAFGEDTLYETHRAPIRWLRSLLRPLLKLLFNPNPLIQALHIQSQLNDRDTERHARLDALHYEVIHNLVVELTRTGIEVKSLKMRLESMASRLDFDERRARALEGVVQYRPGAVPPLQPPTGQNQTSKGQDQTRGQDQAMRGQDQGPKGQDQGRRDQGPRGPRPAANGPSTPGTGGPQGNALDNDAHERRARRRRQVPQGQTRNLARRPSNLGPRTSNLGPPPREAPTAGPLRPGHRQTAPTREIGGRRPALRRGHQWRRGAARTIYRRAPDAARDGRSRDDVRA